MTERGLSPALTTLKRWVKRLGQSVRTGAPCR
jgi:transposase-like protein